MPDTVTTPRIKPTLKVERPKLYKVILVNDDFTPRDFVVRVLKSEFRMTEDQAAKVMMTAPAVNSVNFISRDFMIFSYE